MTVPFTALIGRSLNSLRRFGASFRLIVYSNLPIFCVPTGVIRFCTVRALTTSCAASP